MLRKLTNQALLQGVKLVSHPQFGKFISNPKVIEAVNQSRVLREKIEDQLNLRLAQLARKLNLATRDEVRRLQEQVRDIRSSNPNQ